MKNMIIVQGSGGDVRLQKYNDTETIDQTSILERIQ